MDGATAPAKVRTEVRDRIGVITLNDPATLNAAGLDLMADLGKAFEAFVADPGVRAIVITGEGRGFCSGANLSGGGSAGNATASDPNGPNQALLKIYNPFVSAVRKSPKPLVAAVNGVAAGVGASLARAPISCKPSGGSASSRMAGRPTCCRAWSARPAPWN